MDWTILGLISSWGQGFLLFSKTLRPALWCIQPPTQWVLEVLSLRVKWSEREVDHSLPSSTKVKNAWSYKKSHETSDRIAKWSKI
jgi:hypothetical protein